MTHDDYWVIMGIWRIMLKLKLVKKGDKWFMNTNSILLQRIKK